jgi:hypothetical protein
LVTIPACNPRRTHHPESVEQYRIEQEWLATFEVDRVDGSDLFNLAQQLAKLAQGEYALASRSAVKKTVITLAGALIGEQDVDCCQHETFLPRVG